MSEYTYVSWRGMLERCKNKNHKNYDSYGGRGITVHETWAKFENFLRDMGPRPLGKTLDRINNAEGYSKENCRWATRSEQSINTRTYVNNKLGQRNIRQLATGSYQVRIHRFGKTLYLGAYLTIEEAVQVRDSHV